MWVDADSCPRPVRDVISRASERTGLPVVFIANRDIPITQSAKSSLRVVGADSQAADALILGECRPKDIVVTRDIPLAGKLLEKGCVVLNDRGDRFSEETIRERLSLRDIMKEFRQSGILGEGRRSFGKKELHAFAAALDRALAALMKQ